MEVTVSGKRLLASGLDLIKLSVPRWKIINRYNYLHILCVSADRMRFTNDSLVKVLLCDGLRYLQAGPGPLQRPLRLRVSHALCSLSVKYVIFIKIPKK